MVAELVNALLEDWDDDFDVKDYVRSPSTAGSKPSKYFKARSRIFGLVKAETRAAHVASVQLVSGGQRPILSGSRGGWFTKGGTPITHPNAYAKHGWSNMQYDTNDQIIVVGIDWVRQRLPSELKTYLEWKGNTDSQSKVTMDDFERGIEKEREPYNVDDPVLGEDKPDLYLMRMSRAKQLIEYMCPAPAVEPKPGVKPSTAPGRPAQAPGRRPSTNPFRRRDIRPGEAPRPKAAMESIQEGGGFKSGEKACLPGKAKKLISGKTSGTGASGLTAKKAFKK